MNKASLGWIVLAAMTAAMTAGCSSATGPGTGPDSDGSGTGASPSTGAVSGVGGSDANPPGSGGGPVAAVGGSPGETPTCVPGVPVTSQVPRLTNAQYDRTVRELLGVTTLTSQNNVKPSTLLAPDQDGSVDTQTWSAYQNVAQLIADQVMADATSRSKFMTCTPSVECLTATIESFGRLAFRRPLLDAEKARFAQIVSDGPQITENGTPEEVAKVVLYGFLISPSFLMRAEITENPDPSSRYVLSSHEVASRLAYMLTGSTPDPALNTEADNDALKTPEQILGQAERLLGLDGAKEIVGAFHQSYIGADLATSRWQQAAGTGKDPSFTGFSKELVPTLNEEIRKIFDDVTFTQGGSFKDLLLTNVAFVSDQTAPFYGLSGSFGATLSKTTLDATRPGFLTRLGFLANFADYARSNPILRGAFVTKEVMGVDPGNPDPNVAMTKLPDASTELNTNRKRVEAMTNSGVCAECHAPFVNPPGFALEAFNAVGAAQTTESFNGATIDTVVDIYLDKAGPPVTVSSAAEMMAKIASSPRAARHYAEKMVSFSYERSVNANDACIADSLGAELAGGASIKDTLAKLSTTESFRMRVVGPKEVMP
jgi:hypothetical protein